MMVPTTLRAVIALSALSALSALVASSASAQVLYRRPYDPGYGITAGFDTNGSAGGCADYECRGNCYDGHTGTDFGLPVGTPVLAGASGTVISVMTGCPDTGYVCSPCGGLCGNQVRVRHSDGSETLYCHMQSGGMTVRTGDAVACGQQLGRSASSGCSSGPHLHFGFHASSSSAADDPFRGACGGPVTRWTGQGPYGTLPGTACACTPSGETCDGRDQDCDGRVDEGVARACSTACGSGTETCGGGAWGACSARAPTAETCNGSDDDCDASTDEGDLCEVDLLHEQPSAYAPPRTTDVNADGRADVCARGGSGVRCWPAGATGWEPSWEPVPMADESGWDDVSNYATLRMGDLDGDGRADVCARANAAFHCALSTGSGFGAFEVWRDGLSDENAWNLPRYYTTIRLADVNGDGIDDLCARDSQGFGCWLSNGTAFDRRIEGPRWGDAAGFGAAKYYGTLRMGDLDDDRRADVCIRGAAGVQCVLSDGEGFPTSITGPAWSDESSFDQMQYWSTMRLADVDGDGRDDLCIRTSTDLRCVLSGPEGFGETITLGALSNESGWGDVTNYATLRVGDVDGDGRAELCARGNAGMGCWSWTGTEGVQLDGPAWSDESGWGAAQHYQTIRLADIDGDGLDDICARAAAGWYCHRSLGGSFGEGVGLDELTNAGGWDQPRYWSTILSAGRACIATAESCNGRDDDCDGDVDEPATEICNGVDDDCDGGIDEGLACGALPDGGIGPIDGGAIARRDGGSDGARELDGTCACRASGAGRGAPLGLTSIVLALAAVLARRRRR